MKQSRLVPGSDLDAIIADVVMGLKPGVDFGAWPEHDWKREEDGEIDVFAFETENHNGPACKRCHYGYCEHCQDEPTEPCEVDPPRYSTNLFAAWKIVQRWNGELGYPFRLKLEVKSKQGGMEYATASFGVGAGGRIQAETAALAICAAALYLKMPNHPDLIDS